MKTKTKRYDLIPDIHGHHDKLVALLTHLGYRDGGGTWKHPEGRKVIFLGDYVDRGPKIREVLHTVRGMVDAGDALAIAGNHELNAVLFATPRPDGGFFKEHNERNVHMHAATLEAFAEREDEWAGWLEWMKRLPLFLEVDGIRAVHAAWDDRHIDFLRGKTLADDAFLRATGTKGTREHEAVEFVLKGPELRLPHGVHFKDKEGHKRKDVRVRWWDIAKAETLGDLAMPLPMEHITARVEPEHRADLADYPKEAPPVFVGHYWMPPTAPKKPLAENVVVLDYGAGLNGAPLIGYRWDGEPKPHAGGFVTYENAA